MARRLDGDSAIVNGFGADTADRTGDLHHLIGPLGAAAACAAPLLGIIYGVVRVGYEEYYGALGLTPEVVGLGQAAIVSRVAVIVGSLAALVATWVMFGVFVYRLIVPLRSIGLDRQRRWRDWLRLGLAYVVGFCVVLLPAVIAGRVLGGRGLRLWASGAVSAGVIALMASWMLGDPELDLRHGLRRAARSAYAGPAPRLRLLLVSTAAGAGLFALTLNFWSDTAEAGRIVRATGRIPIGHLNVLVVPARVVPKAGDPLKVCDGLRNAVLVGRKEGVSYVLLFLPGDPAGTKSEVFALDHGDYAVVASAHGGQRCSPGAA